jgi:hypothetical protein
MNMMSRRVSFFILFSLDFGELKNYKVQIDKNTLKSDSWLDLLKLIKFSNQKFKFMNVELALGWKFKINGLKR